jgi:hypothetical protein
MKDSVDDLLALFARLPGNSLTGGRDPNKETGKSISSLVDA